MSQKSVNINKRAKVRAAKRLLKILKSAQPMKSRNDKALLLELLNKKYT